MPLLPLLVVLVAQAAQRPEKGGRERGEGAHLVQQEGHAPAVVVGQHRVDGVLQVSQATLPRDRIRRPDLVHPNRP